MTEEYLFIADCHLDTTRPDITTSLADFLENRAAEARALYILGDLFEVWIGDDDPAPRYADIFSCFKKLSQHAEIFFLCGNRDFLFHEAGAARIGATLITEPYLLNLGDQHIALVHGDSMCSDDVEYQKFRKMVRAQDWQKDFLSKSLADRQQIVAQLRAQSREAMQQKSTEIMDVNHDTVIESFSRFQVDSIIHGHTHRPAIHQYNDGKKRLVLGDWNPQPSYLSWREKQGFILTDPRV